MQYSFFKKFNCQRTTKGFSFGSFSIEMITNSLLIISVIFMLLILIQSIIVMNQTNNDYERIVMLQNNVINEESSLHDSILEFYKNNPAGRLVYLADESEVDFDFKAGISNATDNNAYSEVLPCKKNTLAIVDPLMYKEQTNPSIVGRYFVDKIKGTNNQPFFIPSSAYSSEIPYININKNQKIFVVTCNKSYLGYTKKLISRIW